MPALSKNPILLLAGTTASGKSRLALSLAERLGGEIVNADAIQVYADLRILSARPTPEDEARLPHHLYGFAPSDQAFSSGAWLERTIPLIHEIQDRGKTPILVGGTGLYFQCLTQGLAPLPKIPDPIREGLRARLETEGREALYQELRRVDPSLAARVPKSDSQRLLRGLEVAEATGKPLSLWQRETVAPSLKDSFVKAALLPPRESLYETCDKRVSEMLARGALEEARRIVARNLSPRLPVMKAIGMTALRAHFDGALSLEEARLRMALETRRYARRQTTWIRNQMADWTHIASLSLEERAAAIQKLCL